MNNFRRYQTPIAEMPDPKPRCDCGESLTYVRAVTPEGDIMCIECFEKKFPRMAGQNRFKKSGQQLELPI